MEFSLLLEADCELAGSVLGAPGGWAQGVQAVHPGGVLGEAQGVVSRALLSHLVQPCSYHMSCAPADRHWEGCS